ncbi:GEVED domain-containing protein [Chryseobacterium sp. Leaf394]|uniref:GEVED domain-containing protein n=1 Tax=Chryseobacterium sp. Leaf394 TaxID=1736361 RepID=UPI0006F8423F|nr:GEVED domain-containing protein [Chryseobacterium sp. Leaf394]KQS94246.1 hypothetical protein ASG21_18600 [Chryseobacterium sp. Leaf394]
MKKLLLICGLLISLFSSAQVVQITTGTAGTPAYNAGPVYRSSAASSYDASRYTYLYTSSELATAGITAGTIINDLGWVKNNNATTTGGGIFRIYMKNTTATAFAAASETWANLNTGATMVYQNLNQAIPATQVPNYIVFALNSPFTYTGGSLEISVEWDINQVSGSPSTGTFDWLWSTVPNRIYGSGNTTLAPITTLSSTTNSISTIDDRRPFLQIGYTPGTPCSGAVTAGVASASVSSACANTPFTLSLAGATSAGGITYQWQASPAGANTFTNIVGATTMSYSVTNQTAATDYRCVVTCTNGGSTQTSNVVSVAQNTPLQCLTYCTPVYSTGCSSGDNLNSVVITGVAGSVISDLNTGCNGNGYYDRTSAFTPVNILPAQSYPVQMNTTYSSPTSEVVSIWIDFNDNGVFDASEKLLTDLPMAQSPAFATANIAIPANAPPGVHRMRVRLIYSTTNVDACASATWGETHDYNVNVLPLPACTTNPPSNITVGPITPTTAMVNWVPATGATYILRYRLSPSGPWITVPLNTPLTSSYMIPSLNELTAYDVEIATICGGTTGAFSATTTFTTPAVTYCTAWATSADEFISNVTVTPVGMPPMVSTSTMATASPYYSDYTADPARLITLIRGTAANNIVSVTRSWPGTVYSCATVVWIDWNRNGVFEDSERVLNQASNNTPVNTSTGFAVPAGAYAGNLNLRMRVIIRESTTPTACGTFSWGEVEDYSVKLIDLQPCSTVAPTPVNFGTATATTQYVSWMPTANATYRIRWRQGTAGAWLPATLGYLELPAGQSWHTITGLTEQTAYQVQVQAKCGTTWGAWGASWPFTTPPLTYCPMIGGGTTDHIANVTVSPTGQAVMSNTSTQNGYTLYNTPATLINLEIGSTNNQISVAKGWTGSTFADAVTAWIDYNRDGTFANDERILISPSNTTTPVTATFNVPATGVYTGPFNTTMRVVLNRGAAPTMCTSPANGEVEDYYVKLRPCNNVAPAPPTFTTVTHNSAIVNWVNANNNLNFIVQYRPIGTTTWTNVNASTITNNPPLTLTGLTPATTYEVQISAVCNGIAGTPGAIRTFTTRCDPTPPNVTISNVTSGSATVTWNPIVPSATYILRYRVVGSNTWIDVILPAPPTNTYILTGLSSYVTYEVQIANICVGETTPNPWSNPVVFTTVRVCEIPPPGLTITQLNPTSAEVTWDAYTGTGATNSYILRYRKVGIPSWTTVTVNNTNTHLITGLLELTKYEMQIANVCTGTPGNFTPLYYFTTPTVTYCQMGGSNAGSEYINKVTVTPYQGQAYVNETTGGAPGYHYYETNTDGKQIVLVQGSQGNVIRVNKTSSTGTNTGVAVWIDFNRNGYFDVNEKILSNGPNSADNASAAFTVPDDAFVSLTDYKYVMMRVAMQKDGVPVNCTSFANGEVEDYLVRIVKQAVINPLNQTDIMIYPNPVSTILNVKNISKKANYKIYSAAGQLVSDGLILNNKIDVTRLINGLYVIELVDGDKTVQKKFIKE